jgi:hypothetical protein
MPLAGRLEVLSLVGLPLLEIALYATIADAYLAHHGSIQHKIGWLGHCHGVVHANRTVLSTPLLWEPALRGPGGRYSAGLPRSKPGCRHTRRQTGREESLDR